MQYYSHLQSILYNYLVSIKVDDLSFDKIIAS